MNMKRVPVSPSSSLSLKGSYFIAILLISVGLGLSYGQTLHDPFHFDDEEMIVQNDAIHLTDLSWKNIQPVISYNRPVAHLSNALNFYFNGLDPKGYHIVNLFIHFLTALVIYLLFIKTLALLQMNQRLPKIQGSKEGISLLGTLLWALHPVQTQAVTYIIQRMTSLAALFFILSLLFYILGRQSNGKRSAAFYAISFLAALLAFGTKENTLLLPAAIFLYDLFFISRFNVRFSSQQAIFLVATFGLGLVWILWIYQGSNFGLTAMLSSKYGAGEMDPLLRVMTEWRVVVFYVTLLLFPNPGRMNLDHDFSFSTG